MNLMECFPFLSEQKADLESWSIRLSDDAALRSPLCFYLLGFVLQHIELVLVLGDLALAVLNLRNNPPPDLAVLAGSLLSSLR